MTFFIIIGSYVLRYFEYHKCDSLTLKKKPFKVKVENTFYETRIVLQVMKNFKILNVENFYMQYLELFLKKKKIID